MAQPRNRWSPAVLEPQCLVCGEKAQPVQAGIDRDVVLCEDLTCRLVAQQRHTMPPPAFAHYLALQADMLRQRRAAHKVQAQAVAEQTEREAVENERLWAAAQTRFTDQALRTARLVLPSGPRRLRKLTQRQRKPYREHLERIISEAVSSANQPSQPTAADRSTNNPASALLANLCTLCRGGCCTDGGHTAYLTAATIRRFMALRPELRPVDVLRAYLRLLQPRTEADSCVNHGPGGCGLPREMRSDLCNRYLCATAKDVHESSDPPQAIVALVRRQDTWNRQVPGCDNRIIGAALVTAAGITRLPTDSSA